MASGKNIICNIMPRVQAPRSSWAYYPLCYINPCTKIMISDPFTHLTTASIQGHPSERDGETERGSQDTRQDSKEFFCYEGVFSWTLAVASF